MAVRRPTTPGLVVFTVLSTGAALTFVVPQPLTIRSSSASTFDVSPAQQTKREPKLFAPERYRGAKAADADKTR